MSAARCLLIDAAGTLLWKPEVIPSIHRVLQREGIVVEISVLAERHKLLSELMEAPDVTGWEFYESFNTNLLRILGVPATRQLASAIYESCRSLPWTLSPGADSLVRLAVQVGVVSNWDSRLGVTLEELGMGWLDPVVTSTAAGIRKPDERLFARALEVVGLPASHVLFLGDSVHLDVEPALRVGMRAALYDPDDLFKYTPVDRIRSLGDLEGLLGGAIYP